MDERRHEAEVEPVILRVSSDYPELERALVWLGERGVRCQIEEESARLVPVRHACEDFGFLLEVCDPADFDHACQLLERFDLELVAEDVEAEATDGSPPVPLVPRTSTPITVIVFLLIAAVFVLVAWF
jgi:hypothetical protein